MEKLISFLKTEFPKDALEIQECIELLNQCIGGSVESIKSALGTAFDNRDYAKMSNIQEMLKTVDQVQAKLEEYTDLLQLDEEIEEALGVSVYFEKENINTMSEQSEQMLTILSSIAQGESENISTNVRWGIHKRFGDGSYIPSSVAYGYVKDENGELIIKEDDAVIVRRIYNEYLSGKGSYAIARDLTGDNIPTIRIAEKWNEGVIKQILQNQIYWGELLMQKTYTTAVLPFTKKINHGELPMYSVKDSHEAIITKEQAERVQEIFEYRRAQMGMNDSDKYQNHYEFSGKIICKECGGIFRRQKIYIGKPYEKIQWCCVNHIKDRKNCTMTAVREDIIKCSCLGHS